MEQVKRLTGKTYHFGKGYPVMEEVEVFVYSNDALAYLQSMIGNVSPDEMRCIREIAESRSNGNVSALHLFHAAEEVGCIPNAIL